MSDTSPPPIEQVVADRVSEARRRLHQNEEATPEYIAHVVAQDDTLVVERPGDTLEYIAAEYGEVTAADVVDYADQYQHLLEMPRNNALLAGIARSALKDYLLAQLTTDGER